MTNRKAIEILREKISPCLIAGEWKESVDAAISALQIQDVPDTNVGDTISRQAAIDAFLTELTKRERNNLLHTWSTVEVKYFAVDMLEKLPSAQPTQEIIHCKDCRFWKKYKYFNGKPTYAPFCGFNSIFTDDNDFAVGQKREVNRMDDLISRQAAIEEGSVT